MPATYDEVETLVQSRRLADEIYRELEATKPRWMPHASSPPTPPSIEPEEYVPPPSLPPSNIYDSAWSTTLPVAGAPALLRKAQTKTKANKKRKARRGRSHLHWAVLAMSVAIAIGLWRDPTARVNAKRQLTSETHRVVKSVSATASMVKASVAAHAKRVSARLTVG